LCLFFSYACEAMLALVVQVAWVFLDCLPLKDFVLCFNNIQWKIEYLHEINLHQITRGVLSNLSR